jgi:hypothetical protein
MNKNMDEKRVNIHTKYYTIVYENLCNIHGIAILIQIANWDVFLKMEKYFITFKDIHINYYFVIIQDYNKKNYIDYLKENYKYSVILIAENRGMDIGLFFVNLHYIFYKNYYHDYIIKIHTKTSDEFRDNALYSLFGKEDIFMKNFQKICKKDVGMVSGGIKIYKNNEGVQFFLPNYYHLENIVKKLYNKEIEEECLEFIGGTFFIAKYSIFYIFHLQNIEYFYMNFNDFTTLDYNWYSKYYNIDIKNEYLIYSDYYTNIHTRYPNNLNCSLKKKELGLRDCMIEHAMERIFGYICKKNNLLIV